MNHLDLLSHREVYEVLSRWLRIRKPIE
jgi:hypothetical protein